MSLVNDVGSACRSISRFSSRVERRNVSLTAHTYGALGHDIFFFVLPFACDENKYGRSGAGRSGFCYRRDKPAREIDASKYRLQMRFDASHDARPGIVFSLSLSLLPSIFFLSTSLPIAFHDSLSGFRHRPRRLSILLWYIESFIFSLCPGSHRGLSHTTERTMRHI